jgi:pSer/pThr/pTyr-binding forkhead associated (FHA) protein
MILRIGRSSHCEIQIKDTAISRYQAYLKCENRKWIIHDGNMVEKSKNGTWKREKAISIPVSTDQHDSLKSYVKIGTIKCEI